jgi:hypothetical protein
LSGSRWDESSIVKEDCFSVQSKKPNKGMPSRIKEVALPFLGVAEKLKKQKKVAKNKNKKSKKIFKNLLTNRFDCDIIYER